MKQHMPGFVPVNFKKTGIILLIIGLALSLAKLISYFTQWYPLANYFIYFAAGLILLSLYLIFVVPRE